MKQYINQKMKWDEIKGFQPGCSQLFSDERVEKVKEFIKKHAVNSEIEINPEEYSSDLDDREYDYEISYGYINFVCSSKEEGYKLSQEFNEIADDASSDLSDNYKGWGWDAHSTSYITLTELLNVDWEKYGDVYLEGFLRSIEKMKKIDINTDNVRCVFWFDN